MRFLMKTSSLISLLGLVSFIFFNTFSQHTSLSLSLTLSRDLSVACENTSSFIDAMCVCVYVTVCLRPTSLFLLLFKSLAPDGVGQSLPFTFEDAPVGTQSFALIIRDPGLRHNKPLCCMFLALFVCCF